MSLRKIGDRVHSQLHGSGTVKLVDSKTGTELNTLVNFDNGTLAWVPEWSLHRVKK